MPFTVFWQDCFYSLVFWLFDRVLLMGVGKKSHFAFTPFCHLLKITFLAFRPTQPWVEGCLAVPSFPAAARHTSGCSALLPGEQQRGGPAGCQNACMHSTVCMGLCWAQGSPQHSLQEGRCLCLKGSSQSCKRLVAINN